MLHRTPDNNPFHPGFGAIPEVWAGRDDALRIHARERHARVRGRYTQGVVFIGPSGIGKSVLINRFAQDSVNAGDVVLDAVRIAKRSDPIAQLAAAVDKARVQLAGDTLADVVERQLKRLRLVSIKGVRLAAHEDGISNPHVEVRDSLIAFGEILARENAAREQDMARALLIRIDELQNTDETQRSHLLAALGDLLEFETEIETRDGTGSRAAVRLPVLVYLSGLPDLLNRNTDVDTFRRRFNTTPLGMLTDDDVIDALSQPLPGGVSVEPAAANRLAQVVAGDPYLFQLVGKHAWEASSTGAVTADDVEKADAETYGDRLRIVEAAASDIPDGERQLLQAIYETAGETAVVASAAVAAHLERTPAQIATFAQRLERRAAISRERGEWRIQNRLLRRYLTTGDISPP